MQYTKMAMINNYRTSKTKLVSCCRTTMIAIIFFLGLSMLGEVNMAAGSISNSQIGGGQELQENEEQQRQRLQVCGSSGGVTDGTNTNTTTGIVGTNNNNNNNNTFLYQNPEYGIQILCPENWVYAEERNHITGEFVVYFTSLTDLQQSQRTGETPTVVSASTRELPSANLDLQLFADLNIRDLVSEGYETISTNLNATLSGMPAFEVVFVEPENRTKQLQAWTFQGDRAYAVLYSNHESRFDQSLPIAQDMISSFTIANDATAATALTDNNSNATATQLQTSSEESPSTITSTTTTGSNQSMSLEAAKEQYLAVWDQTEFHIAFSTYIEPGSATGYGIYQEHDNNNIFRPGETILLYAEPVGFGHQQIIDDAGNSLYLMNLTADIIIADPNANELATIEDLAIGTMISHRQNTEMHLTLAVTQDEPFPVGDYTITYIVHDEVSGDSFQISKGITIATDEDSATATTTVQEEQQEQQEEWLLYENATYGISMLYPSTWIQEDWVQQDSTVTDDRLILVSDFLPPEEETEGHFAVVSVWIENIPQNMNLEDYLNASIDSFMQDPNYRDFQILSSSTDDFTLAGMPAYAFESNYTHIEFASEYMLEVGTIVDNRGYFIQYFADPPIYQKYLPIAERMIESFEIGN